ncbi:7490_t:CDS:10 [Diversispora eburnea]|uniref:D-arabinono-1,4-lactone oxidase n=1 Tax=Diversispora eburnea TaxID=1213867 RepID=A0A9N8YMM5_9GLOM|nr:7490_t:CDS:10 [Diversispora eburnea]
MIHLDERLKKISRSNVKFFNWAKTFTCVPELYFEPECEEDVIMIIELAKTHNKKLKAIGSGHSPSDLPCTDGFMVNMDKFNRVLTVDQDTKTVTVEAGIKIHQLNEELNKYGLALSNLGSISDQTISGAISTATHGTGINFGNLCSQIVSLTIVTASKGVLYCSDNLNPDIFKAASCGLGVLGIIINVTIQCENAFRLESIQNPEKLGNILNILNEIIYSAEHVRIWSMFKLNFSKPIHAIDTSYKLFNFDCLFPQYTNEWAIPLERTAEAIEKLITKIEEIGLNVHFPIEIRFVGQDDIWLSPNYERDCCYIGILMYRPYSKSVPYKKYWAIFEDIMKNCDGRPHWAKKHTMSTSELSKSYPKFNAFLNIHKQLDPSGIFLNSYLNKHLYGIDFRNQNEYHPRMTYQQRKSNSQHSKLQQKKDKSIQNKKRSKDILYRASYIRGCQTNNPCAQIHLVKIEFGDYNEFNIDKVTEFNNHNNIIKNTDDINFDDDNNFDGLNDITIKEDYLTQVTRRRQKDKNKRNNGIEISDRRFGPPKFRYKYSSDAIQLCLLRNAQIWIPLKSVKSIEKKDKRVFKLELKPDSIARNLISCQFDFYYSEIKKALIEENIKKAQYITMITHKGVNETELDIIGLHIDYLVKMLNADNQHDSIFLSWGAVGWGSQVQESSSSRSSQAEGKQIQSFNHNNKENEWIIKYNVIDDTRIFRFRAFTKFRTIKEAIKEALQSPFIKEFKYKDDTGEFITISNDDDFSIAFHYYAKKNKLEIWHF